MRPFLSPARIVLLSLIDTYCSEAVRDEDDDFVLRLIGFYMADSYARPSSQRQRLLARWQRAYLNIDLLSHLHSLRPALQSCLVAQPPTPTPLTSPTTTTTTTTEPQLEPEPPLCVTLWDHLVARLWLNLATLDSMVPFFDGLAQHIAPTYAERRRQRERGLEDPPDTLVQLDRRSPLGLLVYQACAEFEQLSFAGRCQLWEDFVRYRHPTRADFTTLWPHDCPVDGVLFDGVLDSCKHDWGLQTEAVARVVFDRMAKDASVPASFDETDRLVTMLIDRERIGFRPSHALRAAVDRALDGSTLVPSQAIFYRLLDAWRMGDANTAYDELHRYFDLVARQGIGAAFGYNVGPMNKAVIQRDFGEHSNDLLSMLDSVHAGREARDYNSLRFALLWLYMYARVLPRHIRPHELQGLAGQPTDGQQVLPYVREDADAAHFHGHHALASLLEARVALGDGRPPRIAVARLVAASRRIVAHGETTLEGQLTSTAMLFWDRAGCASVALAHGRAFMRARQDDVPFDDAARVAARLALLHARSGAFAAAKAAVAALSPEGLTSLRPHNMLRHVLVVVAAHQAVRARRFDDADDLLLRRLPAAAYPSCAPVADDRRAQGPAQIDPELAAHAALLHAAALAARGHGTLVAARAALDRLEATYDKGVADLHVLLQIALARAELYADAGRGLRVLTFVVRTLQACLRRRYHLLLWAAVGALARLLVAEGQFRPARLLLDAVIPRSLESAHTDTSAYLFQLLADACMGLAGQDADALRRRTAPASSPGPVPPGPAAAAITRERQQARMKRHLSQAWWSLGQAQTYALRAGCDAAVGKDIAMKRQVILSVAQRLE